MVSAAVILMVALLLVNFGIPSMLLILEGIDQTINGGPSPPAADYSTGEGNETFKWMYDGTVFSVSYDLSEEDYEHYADYAIDRNISSRDDYTHTLDFITSDDDTITYLSTCILNLSAQAGLDDEGTLNLALRFVQEYVTYASDYNDDGEQDDYWSFPVETLYTDRGDCEDSSFLCASLMEAMGYGSALYVFFDTDGGHMAVGVECDSADGWGYTLDGVCYLYCETTSSSYDVGELPVLDYEAQYVVAVE